MTTVGPRDADRRKDGDEDGITQKVREAKVGDDVRDDDLESEGREQTDKNKEQSRANQSHVGAMPNRREVAASHI